MIFGITKSRKELIGKLDAGAAILLVKASLPSPSAKHDNWYILSAKNERTTNVDRRAVQWLIDHELVKNVDKNPYQRQYVISSKGQDIAYKLRKKNGNVSQPNSG